MKPMTARDLKNSTGEVVRALRRGESILLTFRGKPVGTIRPIGDEIEPEMVEPYERAWPVLERELERTKPRFASWRDAEDASRGRH